MHGEIEFTMSLRTILITATFFVTGAAWSASFNCDNASTKTEKLICSDPGVSALDESMGSRYRKIRDLGLDFEAVKNAQREWLRGRDVCKTAKCLRKVYSSRIRELDLHTRAAYRKLIDSENAASPCETIAKAANDLALRYLTVRSERSKREAVSQTWTAYFPDQPKAGFLEMYFNDDIDSDGVSEHVAMLSRGTANIGVLFIREDTPGARTFQHSAHAFGGPEDMFVVRLGTSYFVLAGSYDRPEAMWGFEKNLHIRYMCEFATERSSTMDTFKGEDRRVCRGLYTGGWEYVTYQYPHSVDISHDDSNRFWSKSLDRKIALVDIDNDGNNESLIRLGFSHGGGRGCDASYIAVTNDERTAIPVNGLNEMIEKRLWGYPCGASVRVFKFEDETYIEQYTPDEKRTLQLRRNGFRELCKYSRKKKTIAFPIADGAKYGDDDDTN